MTTPLIRYVDTTYASGKVGARVWQAAAAYDNFSAVPYHGPKAVDLVVPVSVSTTAGVAPSLPATVPVEYNDGSQSSAAVIWDAVDPAAYAGESTSFTVQGTIAGTSVRAVANVAVLGSFFDDFSGDLSKWTVVNGNWAVSDGKLTVPIGEGLKAYATDPIYADMQVDADITLTGVTGTSNGQNANILLRANNFSAAIDGVQGYSVGIDKLYNRVSLSKHNDNYSLLAAYDMPISLDTTYHVRVVIYGTCIKVYVNDMTTPLIRYVDTSYASGRFGTRVYRVSAAYDNFLVAPYYGPKAIDFAAPVSASTAVGSAPVLPDDISVEYNDGSKGTAAVVWDDVDPALYAARGSFTVEGAITGSSIRTKANVLVLPSGDELLTPVHNAAPLVDTPFAPLPLGSVEAGGWLQTQLTLQKDGLTGHAEEIYSELGANSAWLGGNAADSDWERPAYYVKGLVALAYTLKDQELIGKSQKWMEWMLNSQQANGFFGPTSNNDWWPRMVMLYAIKDYYEATGDERVLTFMTEYFHHQLTALPGRALGSWGKTRVGDNIDVVLWLYNRTGDAQLLQLAELLKRQGFDNTDLLTNEKFFNINGNDIQPNHIVNVNQYIKTPAIYYQLSGDLSDSGAFRAGDVHLLREHGRVTGIPSGTEELSGVSSIAGTETCAIVERMQSNEEAQMILGDPYLGDQLETIAFNELPAALDKEIKGLQYYNMPNEIRNRAESHGFREDHGQDLTVGADSGYPCCRFDFHMGWPYYVKNMWASSREGGLAALAYGPSKVTSLIGGDLVTVTEDTNYPFEEQIRFAVGLDDAKTFPLTLRIPAWCPGAAVAVNGVPLTGVAAGAYYVIDRVWQDGDVVTLDLPMGVKTVQAINNSAAVTRGPLVFSLKIGEQWNQISTFGFGRYEVLPTTDWNYGLLLDDKDPEASVTVNKGAMPGNPFVQATTPVTLTVRAKKVPEWQILPGQPDADEPPVGPVTSAQPVEQITLVPYGAENIRVTYFPLITEDAADTPVRYEAENAVVNHLAEAVHLNVGNAYSVGISNSGYIGGMDHSDSWAEFTDVYAPAAGEYNLHIAYANGGSGTNGYATHLLTVNGRSMPAVKYARTSGWGRFGQVAVVVPLNAGNNTIRLTKGDNYAQLDYIYIDRPDVRVDLSKDALALKVGGQDALKAFVSPVFAYDQTVTWASGDSNVASVSADGTVTGVAVGTTTVVATSATGRQAVCEVTVTRGGADDVTRIEMSQSGDAVTADFYLFQGEDEDTLSYRAIVALYDGDGRFVKLESVANTLNTYSARETIQMTLPGGHTARAYLWDDNTYIPLAGYGAAEADPNPGPLPDEDPVPEGLVEKWNATLDFDGANSYTTERRVQDDMSIAFWIKTTQAAANTALSYQGTALFTADMAGVRDDFGVSMGGPSAGAGKIIFGVGAEGGADRNIRGITTVNDGAWHHVVCTRRKSDNTLQIFVDGRLDAVAVYHDGGRSLNDPQYIVIGARGDVQKSYGGNKDGNATPTDQGMFVGQMSEIRFYDRVLPGEDVERLRDVNAPAALPAVRRNASNFLRVMTMGDSITYGYSNTQAEEQTGGYRQQLWKRLTRAGAGVEFVGRQTNGPNYIGTHNHEGWSGSVIQNHLDNLHHQMANRPDIVALMIGTNDINAYWQNNQAMLETAPDRLNTLIGRIFEGFRANGTENGKLYVALLTKRTPSASGSVTGTIMDRVDAYNEAVKSIVEARKQAGENIELVDMYAPLNAAQPDMYDGLHPTLAGYAQMGDVWFDALKGDFGVADDRVNLASGASVSASAGTGAAAAVDAELATAWEADVDDTPSITVDLGEIRAFTRVMTQFGFPQAGYYYKLEASDNGTDWTPLADKTEQTSTESVYIDDVNTSARYVRLTVTDSVVRPARVSLWDLKILQ
jgi:lysophospholipase L1-like esterase